jgi:hypothetical protein
MTLLTQTVETYTTGVHGLTAYPLHAVAQRGHSSKLNTKADTSVSNNNQQLYLHTAEPVVTSVAMVMKTKRNFRVNDVNNVASRDL